MTNSIEVTDAQTRLDRARDNQVIALYDYNLARIDLATATGTIGDTSTNEKENAHHLDRRSHRRRDRRIFVAHRAVRRSAATAF